MTDARQNEEAIVEERRALGWVSLGAVGIILLLMRSIGMGILLGALMAFTFQPIYERVVHRWRPPAAALATVLGSTLAIALTVGGTLWVLISDGTVFGREAVAALGPGGVGRRVLVAASDVTKRIGISAGDLEAKARGLIETALAGAGNVAAAIASTTASAVLALFFEMLTMYVILRQWQAVSTTAQETLPLRPEYTLKLFEEFRRVGRTTLLSTLVTSLVQGTLATIGYWIVGLPRPVFFGALTAVASPVPGVGTMLVWVPAAIVLLVVGHPGRGFVLLAWGILVVTGIPDYVIRPRLVGRESNLPALLTFIALFGGADVFGLKGLILGPVLMAIAIAVLRLYADEARSRRRVAS